MLRILAPVVFALGACHKAPARIYTDKEIADLEQRVLTEVAKTDASCSHHELLDIETAVGDACNAKMYQLRGDLDPESLEAAKIDEICGAQVLEAFGRASATSPGCSPYQVGVHGEPRLTDTFRGFLGMFHATKILGWHALRETDHYVGLMELLMALGVSQDWTRGRITTVEAMSVDLVMTTIAATSQRLLSKSSLTREQLEDAATMVDAVIAREPSMSAALEGEALSTALHLGVAALKPKDWQPPGGRTDITSWKGEHTTSGHDSRDDAGALMDTSLHRLELVTRDCPASATLATCRAGLAAHDTPTNWDGDRELTDKHAARVAMFPDDKTRRESKEQIVALWAEPDLLEDDVGKRAWAVSRLVALRLRLQVLIDGHCPSEAELAAPPWSTLRAPAVLGDSVQVTRTADTLLVEPPAWATTTKLQPKGPPFPPPLPKPQPVSIPCP